MKKLVIAGTLLFFFSYTYSQVTDPSSGVDPNQTPVDSNVSKLLGNNSGEDTQTVVVKPYERIELNFDSITNLITYSEVVEQPESTSDSLYLRAKKWATKKFNGNVGSKVLFEVDKKNQKVVINGFLPAYSYAKYTKRQVGNFYFKLTFWLKEERYKYTITNFVHEAEKPNDGTAARSYFEYYYTTLTNIRGCDQILRAADKDINTMIEEFKKAMKDRPFVDEDEW